MLRRRVFNEIALTLRRHPEDRRHNKDGQAMWPSASSAKAWTPRAVSGYCPPMASVLTPTPEAANDDSIAFTSSNGA
jgi:hypothetical protein